MIYNPPSCTKSKKDFWGELIHIPVIKEGVAEERSFFNFNCFKGRAEESPTKPVFEDSDIVPLESTVCREGEGAEGRREEPKAK
jgi:hypothetical protein